MTPSMEPRQYPMRAPFARNISSSTLDGAQAASARGLYTQAKPYTLITLKLKRAPVPDARPIRQEHLLQHPGGAQPAWDGVLCVKPLWTQ